MTETTTTPETTKKDDAANTAPVSDVKATDSAASAAAATEAGAKVTAKRKKSKRVVPVGQMHVMATFNNTIITITDTNGAVLTFASAGACGFRGSKKGTAYAAQIAADKAIQAAKQLHGLGKVEVFVKGIGLGREAAVRSLASADIQVEVIKDVTGVPHGGVRPRKARRI